MDRVKSLKKLPETEAVEVADVLLYVIHDIHRLDIAPLESGFDAVIHGHLHCPSVVENSGVLFLNPGSAAQPRRNFPASLALTPHPGKFHKDTDRRHLIFYHPVMIGLKPF